MSSLNRSDSSTRTFPSAWRMSLCMAFSFLRNRYPMREMITPAGRMAHTAAFSMTSTAPTALTSMTSMPLIWGTMDTMALAVTVVSDTSRFIHSSEWSRVTDA